MACVVAIAGVSGCSSSTPAQKEDLAAEKTTAGNTTKATPIGKYGYPNTREVEHSDDYHGTQVKDPYRWLEDADSDDTLSWVNSQNEVTFGYLESIKVRNELKERLTELWNYERYGPPFKKGGNTFYSKNDGLQNQAVFYKLAGVDAKPEVLLDPNTLSKDGTVAFSDYSFSDDGKFMAYATSASGSDWMTWKVRDVATGKDTDDVVEWSKFAGTSWTKDHKGFFYARYPSPTEGDSFEESNYNHKVYYHRLGTPQADDQLVIEDQNDKEHGFEATVSEDGDYVVFHVWKGTDRRNRLWIMPLKNKALPTTTPAAIKLLDGFDAAYTFAGNEGKTFFIQTDKDATRSKLVSINLDDAAKSADAASWKTVIPQGEDKLEWTKRRGGGLLVGWLHDAHDRVTFHKLDGTLEREIELPTFGSSYGFKGDSKDTETYYAFTSFTYPTTIFHLDLSTGKSEVFRAPKVKFNPEDYEVSQVFYPSKDGTKIPMYLVHKKGLAKDGTHPTFLYGYGGFNIPLTPSFRVKHVAWLEKGGVYAMANLRGGGEFGEEWHQAGMLGDKQNVFDDFAAAAEYLVKEKFTSPKHLGIGGRSNGGLLVGASITQRPELFGAALCGVGVLDMLRFHRFTIGHAWVSEYGSADEEKQFPFLYKYSPLHNASKKSYPATLITTADHDDRVVPAHSFKFVATLQKAQSGDEPVMIRIEQKAGHGAGKPTSKQIEEAADEWAFLWQNLVTDAQ
ncbi:MAG: S9 family peptidase [Deltaproteobacteria bacterium]|nr:S9 family peptidase [Deltaproteobacteria bacterium]